MEQERIKKKKLKKYATNDNIIFIIVSHQPITPKTKEKKIKKKNYVWEQKDRNIKEMSERSEKWNKKKKPHI